MDHLTELTAAIRTFAETRDWQRFHTPKNLTMALGVEVAELAELFQWLTPDESQAITRSPEGRAAVDDEIADITIYLLRLAEVLEVDLPAAVRTKLARNEERFPIAE